MFLLKVIFKGQITRSKLWIPIERLFDCLYPSKQFFSYPATVTITGDMAANLDLCLALLAVWIFFLRATPAATWDLSLDDFIQTTRSLVPEWDSNPRRKDHLVFTPSL
jgi:hypothetical protein